MLHVSVILTILRPEDGQYEMIYYNRTNSTKILTGGQACIIVPEDCQYN